jgi:hypothetical protein
MKTYDSVAFALELCGSQDEGNRQTGAFEILGKSLGLTK